MKWIEHKGKKILYCDMRNLDSKQIVALMRETDIQILASSGKLLYLGNVEGAGVSREVMQEARRLTATSRRTKFDKLAAVGVRGTKAIFLNALVAMFGKGGAEIRPFDTEEEAKDWLAE